VRTKLGALLSVIGGFLVVVALLAAFYAPGHLMKTPLDVDNTTQLSGTATLGGESFPVLAWSVTHTNSAKSTDAVVVWQSSSCLVKNEGGIDGCVSSDDPKDRLISAGVDEFATDRVTGLAVNDPKFLPAQAEEKQGLVNKWPFDAEKKTYPYWDDVAGEAEDAVFDRETTIDGLKVYVYKVSVSDAPIEVVAGVNGTYTDTKEIFVEPITGSIVNQIDHQVRADDTGAPVLDLNLAFTEAQVKTSISDAKTDSGKLTLIRSTVPLIGFALGIPLALIGLFLSFAGRRRADASADPKQTVDA
jgi:hypothetical protein